MLLLISISTQLNSFKYCYVTLIILENINDNPLQKIPSIAV